ncbi:MAG: hypothetical protein Tsb0032_24570 [Kiloniellaceae bacterium]
MDPFRRIAPIPRLIASSLAILGLLGHGLAMLAVSLLGPQPVAAQQSAGTPDFPIYMEICAADGLTKWVASGLPGEEDPGPTAPPSGKIDGCPVCTAFAQAGPADLPALLVLREDAPRGRGGVPPLHQVAAASPAERLSLSRGPPAA